MGLEDYRGPRIEIGRWPTPVGRLDRVSAELGVEVWAKLENEPGAWGGNKVRKLEYLLGEAEAAGATTLVAYGAGSSSWAAASAWHGAARGRRVVVGVAGEIPEVYRDLYARTGTTVVAAPRLGMLPAAVVGARAAAGVRRVRTLPAGGSSGGGLIGSAWAGAEIGRAVTAEDIPRPGIVVVAAGTGGTAAGLAVGTALAGVNVPVLAVRVTPRPYGTAWLLRAKTRSLIAKLRRAGIVDAGFVPSPIVTDQRFLGPGYGKPGPEAVEAAATARGDGLELDPGYASKAFAALIARAGSTSGGPLLFVHTSPGPPPA